MTVDNLILEADGFPQKSLYRTTLVIFKHNKSHLVRLDLEVVHNALDIRRDEKSYPHYKMLGVLENLCFA